MKKIIVKSVFSLLLIAGLSSCKDSKEEGTTTTTDMESTSDIPAGDHGSDMEDAADASGNANGSSVGGRSERGSESTGRSAASGGTKVNEDDYSGDGSDGRTESTAVNQSKNVQMGTTGKKKKGYSAPDGTAAENTDGDMYTKHDTTRMPSGSTPIK